MEIVLFMTSFNSTTGGSGGTMRHTPDTFRMKSIDLCFKRHQCNFFFEFVPICSEVRQTVIIMMSCTDKSWSCE